MKKVPSAKKPAMPMKKANMPMKPVMQKAAKGVKPTAKKKY